MYVCVRVCDSAIVFVFALVCGFAFVIICVPYMCAGFVCVVMEVCMCACVCVRVNDCALLRV